jgi:hypothetical protein
MTLPRKSPELMMERGLNYLRKLVIAMWACTGVLAISGPVRSQDGENMPSFPPESPPEALAPGIRPDVYLLRNAKGEPIVVPRIGYEEYERRIRESVEQERDLPTPALTQLDLTIKPEADFARVMVDAELRLPGILRSWLIVPIALPQLQWLPTERGVGRSEIVAQSNGYFWRIEPGLERVRRLKLEALTRMNASNSGNSIRLDLPSTATVVRLRLPLGDWELTASGGGAEVIEPFRNIDEQAVAMIRTTANSLNLVWNRKQERQAITAVEATSLTKFSTSDDGSQIKAVSTWSLRGPTTLAGKRFAITLPSHGKMRDTANTSLGFVGYRMIRRDIGGTLTEEALSDRWVMDVEVDESYARSDLDIALDWQMIGPANPHELAFETPTIEGVQAHSGTLEFVIPRGVVFQWTGRGDIRLIRQGLSSDSTNAMVYSFRFASQPAAIIAAWQSLANQPRLRSSHELEIRERTLSLEGRIEFISDPTQLPLLQLEWSGWQADRITMQPSMLPLDRMSFPPSEEAGRSSMPLNASLFIEAMRGKASPTMAVPSNGSPIDPSDRNPAAAPIAGSSSLGSSPVTYAVEYSFSQILPPENEPIIFSLPRISWLNPDTQQRISRTPPGGLRLHSWLYRLRETEPNNAGLIPTTSALEESNTSPIPFELVYQVAETASETTWRGERNRRPSSTNIVYEAFPTIGDASIGWAHRWTCRSVGGRPNRLMIAFPKGMLLRDLQVDGEVAEFQKLPADSSDIDSLYDYGRIAIPDRTSDPKGASDFLITASSDWPLHWDGATRLQVHIDLPILKSDNPKDGLVVERAVVGQVFEERGAFPDSVRNLDPDRPRWNRVVIKKLPDSHHSLEIEAEWVQTILNAIYQRDRYVARFTTQGDWIDIPIPIALRKDLEVVLDGKRIIPEDSPDSSERVRVEIPERETSRPHVIEVFTLRPAPTGLFRRITLQTPRLASTHKASSVLWQLIVPRTEHLLWNSAELAPLYRWEWKDLFLVRTSSRSQQSLEQQLGATEQPEVASSQTNQYDLTSFSGGDSLQAWFVPRTLVWLPVAAIVLLLSISLGETSLLSKPWLWIAFLCIWAVFSQWSWDQSLLVAQAALGSLFLSVSYALIRWLLNRRARRRSIFVSRSASVANPYQPRGAASPNAVGSTRELAGKVLQAPTVEAHGVGEGS